MQRFLAIILIISSSILASEGFGYPQILDDGSIFAGNYRGAGLFRIDKQSCISAPGPSDRIRARHTTIWKKYLLCKSITDEGQSPCVMDISNGRVIELLPPNASAGVPQPWQDKLVIPYGDEIIIWYDGIIIDRFPNECSVHWLSVDTVNGSGVYVNDDGAVLTFNLRTGEIENRLPALGFKPVWSPDGSKIALIGSDGVVVADIRTGEIWKCDEGFNFAWDPIGNGLFIQKTRYRYLDNIIYSDIVYFEPGVRELNLTNSAGLHEAMPSVSPNGAMCAFIAIPNGDVYAADIVRNADDISLANMHFIAAGSACPKIPFTKRNFGRKSDLWVPYLHQCYDVPDDFNGSSSCGPTSGLMAIQRYSRLPAHTITCSWPYVHTHDFGWYVPNVYEYGGFVFDHPGLAPKVGDYYSDTTVYGAHGLCTSPDARVGTWGDSLVFLINQHDLYSCWLNGTEYVVSWETYTNEINNGYPVPALLPGHYNCFRGYFTNHVIISNDPYGDANETPRKNYNGAGCYYDWSGYDNGYWEANVRFLFAARGTYVPTPADTIVDDFSAGFAHFGPPEYWRAFIGGYDDHAFWTGSVASGSDINYAMWTPNLPAEDYYEVFVYVPSTNATATARYRIFHAGTEDTVVVDQSAFSDEWVSIGTYNFNFGDYIYVGDVTGTSGQRVCCDAIWFSWRGSGTPTDTIVDDGDTGYHRYGDASFWHDGTGGYNAHFFWTYSTFAEDTCFVEWHPTLPDSGNYELFVFIPDNHGTAQARYRIFHEGGEDTVIVNQAAYYNEWVSLGSFNFTGSPTEKLYLGDATGTAGNYIAFDAAWWHLVSLEAQNAKSPQHTQLRTYPNPFNSSCRIDIYSPTDDRLIIRDIAGRNVASFNVHKGQNSLIWSAENTQSGVFYCHLEASNLSKKIIRIK